MGILFFGSRIDAPSQLWMRRMLEGLADDIAVLATDAESARRYSDRFPTLAIRKERLPTWRRIANGMGVTRQPEGTQRGSGALQRAASSAEISIVFVHYLNVATQHAAIWGGLNKPVVVHCHGFDVTWDLRNYRKPRKKIHSARYVREVQALPENVKFIANSVATKRALLEIDVPENRIVVKHLGVEIPASPPEREWRDTRIEVLFLGRLVDCKGPELTIRAFDLACKRGLQGVLRIAGDGRLRRSCERQRSRSAFPDRIKLLGAVDRKTGAELRRRADIFTAHNRTGPITRQTEAFGVSVVEAMADGLPVTTGKSGGVVETIVHGETGLFFAPGDIEAHAQTLLDLAADPALRHEMGRRGWQRARDLFSLDREMRALRKILGISRQVDTPRPEPVPISSSRDAA